ncbi:hypothetical protein OEZ86_002395 [Tetradesmus obliquus]|nr:hypothetical protein OEZ86_002395 [Tetradesmus obliquus]
MSSCMSFSSSSSVPAAFSPQQPLSFNFFTGANESWFEYPETAASGNYTIPSLLDKPKLGIAVSGGGFRAATLGLGWLRALHMLNVTSKARYLTSNSGGSWLNAAFSFQDSVPLDSFLGPYLPPQQLSQQQLQQADSGNGSFAGVIANAGILIPGAAGTEGRCKCCIEDWICRCRHRKGQYWKYWSAIYLPLVCAAGNELALQNGSSTN